MFVTRESCGLAPDQNVISLASSRIKRKLKHCITRPIFIFKSFQFPFSWLHSDVSQSVRDILDTVGSSLVCWLHPHVWSFLLVLTRPLPVDSVAVHILNRGFSAKKAFLLVSSRPTRMAAFCRSLRQGLRGSEKWRAFIEDSPYKPPYLWDIPLLITGGYLGCAESDGAGDGSVTVSIFHHYTGRLL